MYTSLFILKYIEVEFYCYHYSKYIQLKQISKYCVITGSILYIKGAGGGGGGGLHRNSLEIDFIVVSDRGE